MAQSRMTMQLSIKVIAAGRDWLHRPTVIGLFIRHVVV